MKIKWRVSDASTGRYRSFDRRSWPSADYEDDRIAAQIYCVTGDEYRPRDVKTGKHGPLRVRVADYSMPGGWSWKVMKSQFLTLQDAKDAFTRLIDKQPELSGVVKQD